MIMRSFLYYLSLMIVLYFCFDCPDLLSYELILQTLPFTDMTTRYAYTALDELRMWKYAYKKLVENESVSLKGLQIWKEYYEKYDDSRSISSLASHFRKKMCTHLIDAGLTVDEKLLFHRLGKIPLDMDRFKLLCRTMGKMDIYNKHMELLEANKNHSFCSEQSGKFSIKKRSMLSEVTNDSGTIDHYSRTKLLNFQDEINKVIITCKKAKVLQAPKLEEPGTPEVTIKRADSEAESLLVNINDDSSSEDKNPFMQTPESLSDEQENKTHPTENESGDGIQDGQGLQLKDMEQLNHPQPESGNDYLEADPYSDLTVHEIKESIVKEMCSKVDYKLGVFVSLDLLIRKEVFYISSNIKSRKELITRLILFKEKFVKYVNEDIDVSKFFVSVDKKDIVAFNRMKFKTVRKVENSKISEDKRDEYYKKAQLHLGGYSFSRLFRIQHRLQCIEALAASLSAMNENFYYSIMDELYAEIGIAL